MVSISEFFGQDSPFAELLPGFQPRSGQAWMAEAVAEAIDTNAKLVVEAGTGIGKTFAYLLPALQSGRKTIISTGTKALQDQLYHRDLPLLGKAVGRPVTTALLKGRANYLCMHRLDNVADQLATDTLFDDLNAVRMWRHRTQTGDKAELIDVAEDSPVWPLATSTAENCFGTDCPLYQSCYVVRARRQAQEADLVVVNHHLLLADLAMKEGGFVEFLPGAEAIVVDEAHQIPDLAAQFFGTSLGSRELERLVDELRAATVSMQQPEVQRRIDGLLNAVRAVRAEAPQEPGRYEMATVLADIGAALQQLRSSIRLLQQAVAELVDVNVDLERLHEQLLGAGERLAILSGDDSWDGLRWLDVAARSVRLHLTPLDVSATLQSLMSERQAWVFTSATLALGDDFSHFCQRVGIHDGQALTFPSPYDLESNGLIYLPASLPAVAAPTHTVEFIDSVLPLLEMTVGGMFVLFTSHRALNAAKRYVNKRKRLLDGRTLLVQGDAPRDELLRQFRQYGNAVLLGTGSFWEGVDVRGTALTIVAIDKLPFTAPSDPLLMARLEFIRRNGGNGFVDHQLPQSALALKQGAGRLLRDQSDYGVVVLGDPRILGKSYGETFLRCLAPMPQTTAIADVGEFFRRHEESAQELLA